MSTRATVLGVALLVPALGVTAWAQATPEPPKEGPKAEPRVEAARGERALPRPDPRFVASVTLRVQLVISRFQGEKKQASLPYSFLVGARPSTLSARQFAVRMRMGIDTPVPVTTYDESAGGRPKSTGIQYRNVGTNIDCWATDLADGSYQLNLSVENSAALSGADRPGAAAGLDAPLFRRFETFIDPILRDGQSMQMMASTDPVTGEVVKIDVTLNVVK
jgi:hypothetical protein